MTYYKKCNLIAGWGAFAVSLIVYLLTMEPSTSFWDCPEFTLTAYKLEVGHAPGSPVFMLIARLFTMLAPSPEYVGVMVNAMSSLASAFCILFLFWTITHIARKIYTRNGRELTQGDIWTIMGAGLIGALAYTFTDTFWFSAIEAEVYAMSSMFTALVVWAMFQWENVADKPHSTRWLILIAYLMGLSIGVHLLNLLTIPALVFIYYFKKYPKITKWGFVKTTLVSVVILGTINFFIIPYSVRIGAFVDRIFVNGFGLSFNSGMVFFVLAVFAACIWGIWYTHKRGKVLANVIVLCTTVILLGYSSYAAVTIRAIAMPPLNSTDPSNPYSLLSLLEREQYGRQPLLYGPYYSSPVVGNTTKTLWYVEDGKYGETIVPKGHVIPDQFKYLFPRMYSQYHEDGYKSWVDVQGRDVRYGNEIINVPTFGENLKYFFSYQLNFMYWRYFLWNFVGRQNDIQSTGEINNGQWLSGIKFIDELYLGPQSDLPQEMANNKGRNRYYFLPFILGLIGLIYQLNRDKRNFTVVMWLFLMMGVVLVLYFNTTPGEPRERDYAYAGSFYAFCMWIGLGVMWVREMMAKAFKNSSKAQAVAATVVCSVVPILLAAENWDDHDRSHRYVARDVGWNYLQACLPNSIIMNFGDNDSYPVWFNQEVEGVRLDVRVMNMSYLGADWYIDQMQTRINESDPVPFSIPREKYLNNNFFPIVEWEEGVAQNVKEAIEWFKSDHPVTIIENYNFIPAKKFIIPVDKENVLASGIVSEKYADQIPDSIEIGFRGNPSMISKSDLMLLDLLANFDWKRPLFFTQPTAVTELDIYSYLQFDGYSYRFVPIKSTPRQGEIGRVDPDYLYNNIMNVFRYGNVSDPRVYTDYFVQHNFLASQARAAFARCAEAILAETGDTVKAIQVLDAGLEKVPLFNFRYSASNTVPHIKAYYMAGAYDKANELVESYGESLMEYVDYYMQFKGNKADLVGDDLYLKLTGLIDLHTLTSVFRQTKQSEWIDGYLRSYGLE